MSTTATRPPDPFALRLATLADVQRLAAIELDSFGDPWPEAAFRDILAMPHARMSVSADAEGVLHGYCILLHAADEGEIANIAVAPAARRRGLGATLLDDALAGAERAGVRRIFLEVRASNTAARSLYESRGFLAVGRRRAYYRDPSEDALVLRRELIDAP